jgi:two-component system KDP operon response regulator KdpE
MESRILIVEDDPAIRTLATTVLAEEGYEIVEADDPGIEPAARPDLVLLDMGMGFEALAKLVATGVPVLVLTAWAAPELVARAVEAGAQGHIQKPFDVGELRQRVADALPAPVLVAAAA